MLYFILGVVLYMCIGWAVSFAIAKREIAKQLECNFCRSFRKVGVDVPCSEHTGNYAPMLDFMLWPISLIVELFIGFMWLMGQVSKRFSSVWKRVDPSVAARKQAERKHMTVLIEGVESNDA